MRCDAFHQRMDALLDERQDVEADDLLRQHAEVCPPCLESFQAHVELLRWTGGPAIAPRSSPQLAQGYRTLTAVAATVLCVWVWQVAQPRQAEPLPVVVTASTPAAPRAQLHAAPENLDPYLMHQPLVSLGLLSLGDWSDTMRGVTIPFGATLPAVDTNWVDAVATGMTPIQSSLSTTWDAIRRSVTPGGERPTELRG